MCRRKERKPVASRVETFESDSHERPCVCVWLYARCSLPSFAPFSSLPPFALLPPFASLPSSRGCALPVDRDRDNQQHFECALFTRCEASGGAKVAGEYALLGARDCFSPLVRPMVERSIGRGLRCLLPIMRCPSSRGSKPGPDYPGPIASRIGHKGRKIQSLNYN